MQNFRIKKKDLQAKLVENKAAHRDLYLKAMEGYGKAAARFFEAQLAAAINKQPFITYFQEPMPEDHTADYDVLIEAMDWTQDDVIDLTQQEFRQYVRDEWGWKKEFMATMSNYVSA